MESYSIKNIKAFRDKTEIEIKPLTIFVGKNSCGKSSIMRFPVVIAQTMGLDTTSTLKFYGDLIDYGNYGDVVFKNSNEPIEFSLKYLVDLRRVGMHTDYFYGEGSEKDIRPVEIKVSIKNSKSNRTVVIDEEIYIDGELCFGIYKKQNMIEIKLYRAYSQTSSSLVECDESVSVKEALRREFFFHGNADDIYKSIKEMYFPNIDMGCFNRVSLREYYINLKYEKLKAERKKLIAEREKLESEISGIMDVYNDQSVIHRLKDKIVSAKAALGEETPINEVGINLEIDEIKYLYAEKCSEFTYYLHLIDNIRDLCNADATRLSYIGPFRQTPKRYYRDEQYESSKVGVNGERVSTILFQNSLNKRSQLVKDVSEWLYRTMSYRLSVEESDDGLFKIMVEDSNGIKSNIVDVGYGISQILPIVAQLAMRFRKLDFSSFNGKPDDMVIIEQPELHLHPAAQSELANLFVAGALEGNKKLLIETHSEHLIRKLQVLVSDPNCKLTNDDVAVYYVDKDENGVARVKKLNINANGKFEKKWPSGFFDKAHELSMELMKNQ